jgi:Cu/Zn superoxide dismutase
MNAISVFNCNIKGTVKFHQCKKHTKTIVEFNLSGFKPYKTHGIHIHRYGILSVENSCDSTCEHYNPHNTMHGSNELYGNNRHAGDLINNVNSDKNGNFQYSYMDDLINVSDIIGRSVVIHSGVDDLGNGEVIIQTPKGKKPVQLPVMPVLELHVV